MIFCIIITIIFIAEIVLIIISVPCIRKTEPKEEDRGSLYFSSILVYIVYIFPILITLSSFIVILSFIDILYIPKIICTIILSLIIGYVIQRKFDESKEVERLGIGLEVVNGIMMVSSISYQITIFILLKKYTI